MSPSEELDRSSGALMFRCVLDQLHPTEAETVVRRYGLDGGETMTLESIGRRMGFTREGVRQIERRALKKLYRFLRKSRI